MNRKGLSILMRTRMFPHSAPSLPLPNDASEWSKAGGVGAGSSCSNSANTGNIGAVFDDVKSWMHTAISIPADKIETVDASLQEFSQGYLNLSYECRQQLLHVLAVDYDVNRSQVQELMQQYLNLDLPYAAEQSDGHEEVGLAATFYRTERNLRDALKPMYALFFERLNAHPGGLKLLTVLRADLLAMLVKKNIPSLQALDLYLKEKLVTWLSPAALELHQITWDDSASLLEKIVAYEAVHPIRSLIDLKRRLSVGRRCFAYLHPAIPGEPLIFIEVALLKDVARSIQEVLWDDPPFPENEASCALFYSISSTQPGLSGINLGKFIIKRVVELLRRDMPFVMTFATLSPIPGFMQWLLSKLGSQLDFSRSGDLALNKLSEDTSVTFKEKILLPEEESALLNSIGCGSGEDGILIFRNLLTSSNNEWAKNDHLAAALKHPLMRLCARYLYKEKKRNKALDPVANFHLQNGAMIETINWVADTSDKGISQSGGIMVNYIYRLDKIEENAQSYFTTGYINASPEFLHYIEGT